VYALTLVNIPFVANIQRTDDAPEVFGATNKVVVLLTAFLCGFGDAGINNIIYTTISAIWYEDTAPAYALMKELSC